ncbi:MAG: D-aminoacylase [Candidatus Bathyarchaeota archaeon]|nr:D-aminoacylase [Candidatus Bathyarchaeota archaeon]
MEYDILIKNGRVMDGSGNPWYKADVAVKGDKIEAIGDLSKATKVIDAKNNIVAPGFIDIHSHSDMPILIDPRGLSKIHQGVTTEVIGQCGNSAAPMYPSVKEYREKYGRSSLPDNFQLDWTTMKDYMDRIDRQGAGLNIAPVVGHGTVRMHVLSHENREPTESELKEMRKLVAEAMTDGAWGMSTGLIYPPSVYGKAPEIIELTKEIAKHGGIYFSHIRGEGATLLDAVEEACEIGKAAGAPIQIAHFKASGKPYWGKTKESLALVEKYRDMGVDVTFDQYPYIASSTGLTALLPHWAHEGGAEKMLEHLNDPETRKKIKGELRLNYGPDKILVTKAKNNPQYTGKNLQEIGEMMNKNPIDAMFDLLVMENTQVPSVMFGMNEEDVRRVMQSPYGMVGSDGSAICPEGIWKEMKPHPRLYGTFPRVLGHYVREGVISLQEALRKMTSAPAQRIRLNDRGFLREGYKADITVFDPATIKDEATFTDSQQYASGIPYVLVNGVPVIEKGKYTGALPGKTLRKA